MKIRTVLLVLALMLLVCGVVFEFVGMIGQDEYKYTQEVQGDLVNVKVERQEPWHFDLANLAPWFSLAASIISGGVAISYWRQRSKPEVYIKR